MLVVELPEGFPGLDGVEEDGSACSVVSESAFEDFSSACVVAFAEGCSGFVDEDDVSGCSSVADSSSEFVVEFADEGSPGPDGDEDDVSTPASAVVDASPFSVASESSLDASLSSFVVESVEGCPGVEDDKDASSVSSATAGEPASKDSSSLFSVAAESAVDVSSRPWVVGLVEGCPSWLKGCEEDPTSF